MEVYPESVVMSAVVGRAFSRMRVYRRTEGGLLEDEEVEACWWREWRIEMIGSRALRLVDVTCGNVA
jgi:hypothetical protein